MDFGGLDVTVKETVAGAGLDGRFAQTRSEKAEGQGFEPWRRLHA